MTDSSLSFSTAGDALFRGVAACFPQAKKKRLALEQPIDRDLYHAIRAAAAQYVSMCLGSHRTLSEAELVAGLERVGSDLPNYSSGGVLLPMRKHSLEHTLLHKQVTGVFADTGLGAVVDEVDLPINVRVVHGKSDPARADQPYASSKLHCDVWAGVPADAVVVVLPLFGAIDDITIELGEMARERERSSMRALASYDELRDVEVVVPYSDVHLRHGFLYLADARLMHKTVRRRPSGVRLSIDFRFRLKESAYRHMVDEVRGPDAMSSTVPFDVWMATGTDAVVAFDASLDDPATRKRLASSSPVAVKAHRLVQL